MEGAVKYPAFMGSLTAGGTSCNGAPEGDHLSVAAMVAVCWHSHQAVHDLHVQHLPWSRHVPS